MAAFADAVIVGSAFVTKAGEGIESVRELAVELAQGGMRVA